jgi:lysozyme
MTVSEKGYSLTKQFEECRLTAYLDQACIPTIGWGTIVYTDGTKVKLGDTITQSQADNLLQWEVNEKTNGVNHLLQTEVNQNQFDALCDFAYNVGLGGLHGSTLLRLVNANPQDSYITAAFMMWDKVHVNGELIEDGGLKRRRLAEAELYFSE